jgi:hypothetical protein
MTEHGEKVKRPLLAQIIDKVYIPKFNVKRYSPYFYAGETKQNTLNYREFQNRVLRDQSQD